MVWGGWAASAAAAAAAAELRNHREGAGVGMGQQQQQRRHLRGSSSCYRCYLLHPKMRRRLQRLLETGGGTRPGNAGDTGMKRLATGGGGGDPAGQ